MSSSKYTNMKSSVTYIKWKSKSKTIMHADSYCIKEVCVCVCVCVCSHRYKNNLKFNSGYLWSLGLRMKQECQLFYTFWSLRIFNHIKYFSIKKKNPESWTVWLSRLGVIPQNEGLQCDSQSGHMPGLQVRSPVRALMKGNQSMFLSLSFSLPTPLPKNKLKS